VRWESQQVGQPAATAVDLQLAVRPPADAALFERPATIRTFDTPQFAGMTFYEVYAKSILNKVPAASQLPFNWTINPYRGCTHACRYCFARNTHTYLEFDAGLDFDSKIVVKVNAPALLRRELARPAWKGEAVAMGTNVDCYQRAEGRYQLMPGILQALIDAGNPFSILTKGSLILRDLPLLERAAEVTSVSTAVSVGFIERSVWRDVEPGTPSPRRRLQVCKTLNDAGISCGVLMAPILPGLTDSSAQLAATVEAIAESDARYVSPIVLHLRPGAREWFMAWLETGHPELVSMYRQLYGHSTYAPKSYSDDIYGQVRALATQFGIGKSGDRDPLVTRARQHRELAASVVDRDEQMALPL
jgi:DNA repair photolyase